MRVRWYGGYGFPSYPAPLIRPCGAPSPCGGKVCLSAWGLSRVVSWSALILQRHKKARLSAGFQVVEKGHIRQILCKSLAEFRRPQTTESSTVCFFRGHVPRKKHCSGRKRASEASAMQRPAFLREPVDFVDRLKARLSAGFFLGCGALTSRRP